MNGLEKVTQKEQGYDNVIDEVREKLEQKDLNILSRAIVHAIFRTGPIEDIHAEGKLSEKDMCILNKSMMNEVGYLLKLYFDGEKEKLRNILFLEGLNGSDWDEVNVNESKWIKWYQMQEQQ